MQCRACIATDTGFTPLRRLMRDECRNYMTKWLCGTSDVCMDGSTPAALTQALHNLRDGHVAVAVLEHLPESLRLLHTVLPDYFPPLPPATPAQGVAQDARSTGLPHEHRGTYPAMTDTARALIRAWNANDIAL